MILEFVRIEQFLPNYRGCEGRPQRDRKAIARAFVAKMVYNMDSTVCLLERLETDKSLRRICGWENRYQLPSEATFSRAFADFALLNLPGRVHNALIENSLKGEVILHSSQDSTAIEISRPTIIKGIKEVQGTALPPTKGIRKKGAGRKTVAKHRPEITEALAGLIEPMTRGDPETPLKWTCKSTRNLAKELAKNGLAIGYRTVATVLHELGYSLQANRKTLESSSHEDRNAQFEYLNRSVQVSAKASANYFCRR